MVLADLERARCRALADTRACLDTVELAAEIGPLTIPPPLAAPSAHRVGHGLTMSLSSMNAITRMRRRSWRSAACRALAHDEAGCPIKPSLAGERWKNSFKSRK